VAKDPAGPVQRPFGRDGTLYVTEAAGTLARIDLATGARTVLADKLALPEDLRKRRGAV
jgi:hypothetical protein